MFQQRARPASPANDTQAWTRPGWNPVYGSWEASAAGNALAVNWSVPAGDTLRNPVLRVRNYTAAAAPAGVRLNGAAMVADTDVLMSVDSGNSELWITLRTLSVRNTPISVSPVPPAAPVDIDGDGAILPTTDGLVLLRAMLGLTDAAALGGSALRHGALRIPEGPSRPEVSAFTARFQPALMHDVGVHSRKRACRDTRRSSVCGTHAARTIAGTVVPELIAAGRASVASCVR